jgi:uncharacterized protein DUF4352
MRRLAVSLVLPVAMFLASCGLFHKTSAPAGTGQEVVDGKFAFIVTQVDSSPTFDHTRAQGVYVIVSMALRNVGTQAQVFDWGAQRLKDGAGRQYSASFVNPSAVIRSIDPGLQVSIDLAFDVPPGTKPKQLVLHDSASSQGVPVNLNQPPSRSPASSPAPARG